MTTPVVFNEISRVMADPEVRLMVAAIKTIVPDYQVTETSLGIVAIACNECSAKDRPAIRAEYDRLRRERERIV